MATDIRCWWQNYYVGDFFIMLTILCIKSVTNISKLSPTHFVSNIHHQHRCSLDWALILARNASQKFLVFRFQTLEFSNVSNLNLRRIWIRNHGRERTYIQHFPPNAYEGYIDVGYECWRRNMLLRTLRCWWRFWPFQSPTSIIFLH